MVRVWDQPRQIILKIHPPKSGAKWTEGVTQAVQHLLCKHEVLSSNPSLTKKKSIFFPLILCIIFLFLFGGTRAAIQGCILSKQALHHLSHSANPPTSFSILEFFAIIFIWGVQEDTYHMYNKYININSWLYYC
jgi:hypothetical protein